MAMDLSIIIVSSNCQTDLLNCLASVYKFPPIDDFEIIVVDNASSDQTVEVVKNRFSEVRLIVNPKNLGFAAANNQGAKNASGDYLFFLNPDTIISNSNTFDPMNRFIGLDQKTAIIGPRLVDKDGSFQWSCGPIPSVFNMILDKPLALVYRWFGSHQKGSDTKIRTCPSGRTLRFANGSDPNLALRLLSFFSYRYYQGQEPIEVGFVSGAAMMIKKSVFDELNGFDERFFLYFEDVDLCLRAQKAGFKVVYLPTVQITHLSGQSQKERLKQKEEWYHKSQRYFFSKHKRRWERALVELLSIPYRLLGVRSRINKYY